MIWSVSEMRLIEREVVSKNAGGKARKDLNTLFKRFGISEIVLEAPQLERKYASPARKIHYHFQVAKLWKEIVEQVHEGDTLIIQFPPINHSLLLAPVLKEITTKGVKLAAFIHDLEMIRHSRTEELTFAEKWRLKKEELDELSLFDVLIVHNEHMKTYLHDELGIQEYAMCNLDLFDYLISEDSCPAKTEFGHQCIIAGNLNKAKSAFVYELPDKPDFELYGIGFEENDQENIHYHGSFTPEELPKHMSGSYGLVWDGDSASTCSGVWGRYLRYNNPHKTSLYLACGIPVITWKEAAIADFILKNDVGITVGSLEELETAIRAITPQRYQIMKKNAEMISAKIRAGYFTRKALEAAQIIPAANGF